MQAGMMFSRILGVSLVLASIAAGKDLSFTYNGMARANLSLDGAAQITSDGLLVLTNETTSEKGHAFYPNPISFKHAVNIEAFSFSTSFVFAIVPLYPNMGGHGLAFVIAPERGLPGGISGAYLGLFSEASNGQSSNRVVAVEFDTIQSIQFNDSSNNHVGIDINDLKSRWAEPAGYYENCDCGRHAFKNLTLISGNKMQAWVEYDGARKEINVTLALAGMKKPEIPLLSKPIDLSPIIPQIMYVGFSSSTGAYVPSHHYILGWSFRMKGEAQKLDLSKLPKVPMKKTKNSRVFQILTIGLPLIALALVFGSISLAILVVNRKRKFAEEIEEWELDYATHRFKYEDLYKATKGFSDEQYLGSGGFGRVYKGLLRTSNLEVAVKRVNHESRQGIREFVAEIISIGRLRHRNIVSLLGYCRRKTELLLVYDYMANGSLDKYLHGKPRITLNWAQRFQVIKGVASALCYLHEGWEQVVVHRDVKASNILLDGELNARLGDFGLARLYDHGCHPQSTLVVGTLGYLAPELSRTSRATTSTDVFAFGGFLLEVACGKRPIQLQHGAAGQDLILVDWVFSCWERGQILETSDPALSADYVTEEMEMVLKLGLMCSQSEPSGRPTMRLVLQYLEREIALPNLSSIDMSIAKTGDKGFHDPSTSWNTSSHLTSVSDFFLSGGR